MKKALLFLIFLVFSAGGYSQSDLGVTINDYKTHYSPAGTNIYTIVVVNNGPDVAHNVLLEANVPAGVEDFEWVGPDDNDLDTDPEDGNHNIYTTIPEIPVGGILTWTATVKLSGALTGNFIFQANVSSPAADPNMDNNEQIDIDLRLSGADIQITNTNNQQYYIPGTTSTYTIKVTNKGPLAAENVQVTNALPSGVLNASWTGSNGSSGTNVGLNNTIETLEVNQTVTYTLSFDIPEGYISTITSVTNYTSTTIDPSPACPACTDTDEKLSGADLVTVITDGQTTYTQGGTRIYTITVTNNGPEAAENVHVVDAIPAGITQFSWTGSNGSSGTDAALDDAIATLANGAVVTYTVTVVIPDNFLGNLKNEVVVTSTTSDPYPGCTSCIDVDTLSTTESADLIITNTDGQFAYVPGQPLTYTVTVKNAGPSVATNVHVFNSIPTGITQFSWTGSNGTSGTNTALSDIMDVLEVNQEITYTITVQVPAVYSNNLRSEAVVTSTTPDPSISNNQSVDMDVLAVGADIVIVNTNNQTAYLPGQTVVYTVTVKNNGPANAGNFTVNGPIPAGVTNFSWSGSNGSSGTNIPLANNTPTFTAGSTIVYTVQFDVPAGFSGNLVYAVSSTTATPDPNFICAACVDTDVRSTADLVVTNTNNQAAYIPGGTSVYTVIVTNNGPHTAQNVVVSNPIPTGITNFSWTGSNGSSGTDVNLSDTIAALANGQTVTYTITLQVPMGFTGNLESTATVSSASADPDATTNQVIDTDVLAVGADIVVVNTNGQDYYSLGSAVIYTVTVTNNGPGTATGVAVQNLIPAGITSFSWVGTNGSMGSSDLNNTIGTMLNGASVTYTITLQVPSAFTGELISQASVTSANDPNPICTQCIDIDQYAQANIEVNVTDNKNSYTPGTVSVYKVTVTNNGPLAATNVQVSNPIPAGITTVTWTDSNGGSGTGALSDIIALAAGETIIYTVSVEVPSGFTGNLTNIASVSSPLPDAETSNNQSTDINTRLTGADIVVVNTDDSAMYVAGKKLTYTVRVTNFGPDTASNVVVQNLVPAGIPNDNCSWEGNSVSGTGELNNTIGTLAVGQTVVYMVYVDVPSSFGQTTNLVNEVIVSSSTPDPNPGCAQCIDINTPNPLADLQILKTDNKLQYLLSPKPTVEVPNPAPETNVYTIVIHNNGPSDALAVNVMDYVPAGIQPGKMTWVGSNGTKGSGNLVETIDLIKAGEAVTFVVTIVIPTQYPPGNPNPDTNFVNSVSVTSGTTDPNINCPGCVDIDTPRDKFLTVNATKYNLEQLVKDILIDTPCVSVDTFTQSTGGSPGLGYFHRNNSDFPFKDGIVLRTGNVNLMNGPYDGGTVSSTHSGNTQDPDLQAINDAYDPNDRPLWDTSFLKFRFKPTGEEFSFNFIYASNEYGQYQCQYSDVFAFILTDLNTGVIKNLAVIPSTTTPVSSLTIRNTAYNSGCGSSNVLLFDQYNANPPQSLVSAINMKGQTVPMTAYAQVDPTHTYTIKLVIGDYAAFGGIDTLLDSAVFIEGGTFNIGLPDFGGGTEDGSVVIDKTSTTSTVCGGIITHLSAGSAALPGVQYSWTRDGIPMDGETNYFVDVEEGGTYGVTFSFATGCSKTTSYTLVYDESASELYTAPKDINLCTTSAPFAFNIYQNDYILQGLNASEYVVSYYDTEDKAKYDFDPINPEIYSDPLIYNVATIAELPKKLYVRVRSLVGGTACAFVDEFEINAFVPEGTISYQSNTFCFDDVQTQIPVQTSPIFTPGGKFISVPPGLSLDENTGMFDIALSSAGTYTIKYQIEADACDEFNSNEFVINLSACITTTLDPEPPVCVGATFELTTSDAGVGSTYEWFDASGIIGTTSVPSLTLTAPTVAGTYTYSVKAVIGTESSSLNSIALVVNPIPEATISGDPIACAGGNHTITFTGTPEATVVYNDGTVTNASIQIEPDGTSELVVSLSSNTTFQIVSVAGNTTPDCIQTITAGSTGSFLTVTVGLPDAVITGIVDPTLCTGGQTEFTVTGTPNAQVNYLITYGSGTTAPGNDYLDATGFRSIPTGPLNFSGVNTIELTSVGVGTCTKPITGQNTSTTVYGIPTVSSFTASSPTVCSGDSVVLNFVGTANATVTYSDGATNHSVLLDALGVYAQTVPSMTAATTFTLVSVASNTTPSCFGTPSLPSVSVGIDALPAITDHPDPVTLCPGSTSAVFSVSATGTSISYLWYNGAGALTNDGHFTNVTTNTLTINNPTAADVGNYYCVVTNSCATANSNPASLNVDAPTVILPPVATGGTVCEGDAINIAVNATGVGISYQWYFGTPQIALVDGNYGGTVISGAGTPSLSITGVTTANAGIYNCIISNTCSNVSTSDIVYNVNTKPQVASVTTSVDQCAGDLVSMSVSATGTGITYQWYKGPLALSNGGPISGADTATLSINPAQIGDSGSYYCVVSGACTPAVTSASIPTVIKEAPSVTTQPLDTTICEGQTITMSITTPASPYFTYQWQKDGVDVNDSAPRITGAITATLVIANATAADAGSYVCIVSNGICPSKASDPAIATVNASPRITDQPDSSQVCVNDQISLSLIATGNNITYQWQFNGSDLVDDGRITGSNTADLRIAGAQFSDEGSYSCIVSSASCPDVPSAVARILIIALPVATITHGAPTPDNPFPGTICAGNATDLLLNGTPNAIVTYTVNSGAEQTIILNPIGTAVLPTGLLEQTTSYELVRVTRNDLPACPAPLSSVAVITVNPAPAPELDQDGYICIDLVTNDIKEYVLDTGLSSSDYTFQWTLNGVSKGNGSSLSVSEAGLYTVLVTDIITGCERTATAPVGSSSPPISITATAETMFFAENATITVTVDPPGEYEYRLDDGPYQSSNVFTNVSTLTNQSNTGTHTVYARDLKACGEREDNITIIDYPKYFTPNGDGYHDTWNISTLNYQSNAKIYIFDRFGKLVKQISTTGTGWDGTFNGQPMLADDYWFVIKYLEAGVNKEFKAHFALKR